jgi:peptidoglycan/LPS O-acetylase OafA/YrhL
LVPATNPTRPSAERVPALDAIRFVCALAVVYWHVTHVAWPDAGRATDALSLGLRAVARSFSNGPAAVIVFFVISGFCIHFPFRNAAAVHARAFVARRFLRIGLPFAVALALAGTLHWRWMELTWASFGFLPATAAVRDTDPTVFWSLIAEMVYYALYPALFAVARRWGWRRLAIASYAPAVAVMLLAPRTGEFQGFGNSLAPVAALPAWLWGCVLADRWDSWRARAVASARLWLWRGAVVAAAAATLMLRYHAPVAAAVTQLPWTLHPFAALVFLWLQREIASARLRPPPRALEWCGTWSYSLYLVHLGALELWLWAAPAHAGRLPVALQLPLQAAITLLACYAFHLAVERPSWRLARFVGVRLQRPAPAPRPLDLPVAPEPAVALEGLRKAA